MQVMDENINRLDYLILQTLKANGATTFYDGITIVEIMEQGVSGARVTLYRKLQKLCKLGYIGKGIVDDHADTYWLKTKSEEILGGKE